MGFWLVPASGVAFNILKATLPVGYAIGGLVGVCLFLIYLFIYSFMTGSNQKISILFHKLFEANKLNKFSLVVLILKKMTKMLKN